MKAVVYRGARTLEIDSRVAEAPAPVKERGGRGINVNTIAPSCIATDNTEASGADPRRNQALPGGIPAGCRRSADDLAGAAVFPASPASDCVNGIVLPVDDGRLGR